MTDTTEPTNEPAVGQQPVILVIDDDTMASRPLIIGLKAAGYEVVQGYNAKEGMEMALGQHPSLIILDYKLPDQDGVKVLEQLRKDTWGKDVPVIFATNTYEVDVMNDVMALGVRDYILKSDITLDDTVKLVGTYIPLPAVS